jgi:hypothetical protein
MPLEGEIDKNYQNTETVIGIENNSRNSEYTLDGVIDFMNFRHKDIKYKVFKELFVIWGRNCQKSRDKTYLSRVDIELINEQIKLLFCSGCS